MSTTSNTSTTNTGTPPGTGALTHLAGILVRATRIDDECFRIGGDEFAVLLPAARADEALAILQRAQDALAASPPGTGALTFSTGLVEIRDADTAANAFALADRALYQAKAAGRSTDRTINANPP